MPIGENACQSSDPHVTWGTDMHECQMMWCKTALRSGSDTRRMFNATPLAHSAGEPDTKNDAKSSLRTARFWCRCSHPLTRSPCYATRPCLLGGLHGSQIWSEAPALVATSDRKRPANCCRLARGGHSHTSSQVRGVALQTWALLIKNARSGPYSRIAAAAAAAATVTEKDKQTFGAGSTVPVCLGVRTSAEAEKTERCGQTSRASKGKFDWFRVGQPAPRWGRRAGKRED